MQSDGPENNPEAPAPRNRPLCSILALIAPFMGMLAAYLFGLAFPRGNEDGGGYAVAWRYVLFATPAAMGGAILGVISLAREERYYGLAVAALAINLPISIQALLLDMPDFPMIVLLTPPALLFLFLGLAGMGMFRDVRIRRHTLLIGVTIVWWAAGFELHGIDQPSLEIEVILGLLLFTLLVSGAMLLPRGAIGLTRAIRSRNQRDAAQHAATLVLGLVPVIPFMPFVMWGFGCTRLLTLP